MVNDCGSCKDDEHPIVGHGRSEYPEVGAKYWANDDELDDTDSRKEALEYEALAGFD